MYEIIDFVISDFSTRPSKRSSDGGCTCRTDCSSARCGCKKVKGSCNESCKCSVDVCQNRNQVFFFYLKGVWKYTFPMSDLIHIEEKYFNCDILLYILIQSNGSLETENKEDSALSKKDDSFKKPR